MSTYCLDLFRCSSWNYSKESVNHMFIEWRKVVCRLCNNIIIIIIIIIIMFRHHLSKNDISIKSV